MVRSLSELLSRSWAPASCAKVCWKLWSVVSRAVTMIADPDTPRQLEAPLLPEKVSHGGEYGSPGICSVWPPQALTTPGVLTLCPADPLLPAVPAVPPVPLAV